VKKTSARPADEIEIIVSTYADMLFRLSLIILGNQNDAEDVVQETMLKYMKKTPVFESEQHRKAWLITVARNKCRDIIRFRAKHPTVDIDELRNHSADNTDSGILEALVTLPEKIKSVMILYYVEDFSVKEIASITGKTESAIKMRLQKGRRLLAEKYRKEFM